MIQATTTLPCEIQGSRTPTTCSGISGTNPLSGNQRKLAPPASESQLSLCTVGPGPVETGKFNRFARTKENKANFLDAQVPDKRIGTPEEIANAILFIGSDKASYIGASLAVDAAMIAD
jgi:NAD(P)-dependent dehydrogenase (short-subunit alcohol dehydrogenase family)